jgi:hypothetical protein
VGIHRTCAGYLAGGVLGAGVGVVAMSAIDLAPTVDDQVYAQLSEWFGERAAEAMVPCSAGFWPLTPDETRKAHAHYAQWRENHETED